MSRGRTTAAAVKDDVGALGGAFMISIEAKAAGKAAGLRGRELYFGGRCGVLGDVDADVVVAAAAFWPPEVVRPAWEAALAAGPAREQASAYANVCHAWGRRVLAGQRHLGRLAELLARVADAADVVGAPLFAGWRALPRPADPPARVAHLAHVLREQRGGLHAVAVLASGLTPLQAVVAGPRGAVNARFFGWPQPYPDPTAYRAARERAEALTDELVAPAYARLAPAEADELVELLAPVAAAARS